MTERRARRKPGENRARLIQAGLYEFGLYGYQGTSTARIAARAGIPQPHVYANFSGKAELFHVCLQGAVEVLAAEAATASEQAAAELVVFQAVAAAGDPVSGPHSRALIERAANFGGVDIEATVISAARQLVTAHSDAFFVVES